MVRYFLVSGIVLWMVLLAGPVGAGGPAQAMLRGPDGQVVGTAIFLESGEGVTIVIGARGLEPGYHGLHIHEAGSCEPPGFKSAGGHFNPYGREHGRLNSGGPHAGDLPNLLVDPRGVAATIVDAPLVTMDGGKNSLLRKGGTALIIHAGPDDHRSQPTGSSGGRDACGVIRPLTR